MRHVPHEADRRPHAGPRHAARAGPRRDDHRIDEGERRRADRRAETDDRRIHYGSAAGRGGQRRGLRHAEPVRGPAAWQPAQRAHVERVGRRRRQLAVSVCGVGAALRRSGLEAETQVGVRIPERLVGVRPARRRRRTHLRRVRQRIRVCARCRLGMCLLVVSRGRRRADRDHDRQGRIAVRRVLRRRESERLRRGRRERQAALDDERGIAPARARHRRAGVLRRAAVRPGRVVRRGLRSESEVRVLHLPRIARRV